MPNVGKGGPGDPDHGWPLYIVSVVMVILSGIFVVLRVAFRASKKMMGADDWIILAALISLVILSLTECLAVVHGYGKHSSDLSHPELFEAFKWFYGAQIIYKICVCLYKESILFLYLRIFPDQKFRWMCWTMIALVTASSTAFTLVTIWQCKPIAAFWDKALLTTVPGARCFSSEAFWFSYSLINILLDVIILILPIHEVVKLQLPWREKGGLLAVFSLGVFVCATSIIRTTTLASSATSTDASWGYIPATVWSVVEANTGTICACLPMLKQPLSALFPRLFGSTKVSTLGNSPGDYPLASKKSNHRKNHHMMNRHRPNYSGSGMSTDYHHWAMRDGTIMRSKDEERGRESEERIIEGEAGERGIVRTTDVNVMYHDGDEEDSIPSLKNHVYAG